MKAVYNIVLLMGILSVSCGPSKRKYDSKITMDPSERKIPKYESAPKEKESKEVIYYNETEVTKETPVDLKVSNIINTAKSFHGAPYKFGGTTTRGIDCSGLVLNAFKEENISLPRQSSQMATHGKKVSLNEVAKGDLVFFKTDRKRNSINHVGIVVDVYPGKILFIHSSTSQGVIISALDESYWRQAFVEARRVIDI